MLINAKYMYPSVKFGQIEKSVNYFLSSASDEDKETVHCYLDIVKFGMANIIVTCMDQNWDMEEMHLFKSKSSQLGFLSQHHLLI